MLEDLQFGSERDIAIFDLDGVLTKNPVDTTTPGRNYWHEHWSHPERAVVRKDMTVLMESLLDQGWHVIILTGRPEDYREETTRYLTRIGFPPVHPRALAGMGGKLVLGSHTDCRAPALIMEDCTGPLVGVGSGAWKAALVAIWLAKGARIRFVVEDYKSNADALRKVVPVLLYEQVR